jgi:hypothetical protein
MPSYSFQDTLCAIAGPGGAFPLGSGSGAAKEGITITAASDRNVMLVGADGDGVNSLLADSSSTVTVRLLKTSPVNAALMQMMNLQSGLSSTWGINVITVTNIATGDATVLTGCAFKTRPEITYAAEAGVNEWTWDCIGTSMVLGVGTPEA